jgi:hypothetical protein
MKNWFGKLIVRCAVILITLVAVVQSACAMGTASVNLGFVSDDGFGGELQIPEIVREYRREDYASRLHELRRVYGNNKIFAEEYELASLIALSHYPELKDVPIRFVVTDYFMPIAAPPRLQTMLGGKSKWEYDVVISTSSEDRWGPLLLENIPFNGQVGIIGHELAHIADYRKRSLGQMIALPLCILKPECRAHYEQETDRRNIEHGLGWQRYDHSSFVRRKFRERGVDLSGNKTYMGPAKILEYMRVTGLYDLN